MATFHYLRCFLITGLEKATFLRTLMRQSYECCLIAEFWQHMERTTLAQFQILQVNTDMSFVHYFDSLQGFFATLWFSLTNYLFVLYSSVLNLPYQKWMSWLNQHYSAMHLHPCCSQSDLLLISTHMFLSIVAVMWVAGVSHRILVFRDSLGSVLMSHQGLPLWQMDG